MTGTTADARPGTVLAGRYEIVRHLARGGMGEVVEAVDRQLQRPVAVKVLHAGATEHAPRFETEVQLLAGLNHPGLVQVYDAGHDGDCRFVVLELVPGPPLRQVLDERGALPAEEVAAIGAALAEALAYVHASGVVHRDVTPGNVLCGPDGPKLTDFGIARLADTSRITATGTTIGTARYMAPEQVQGGHITHAADVYALGLVLLEALTGRPAFEGTTAEVAVARLVRDPDTSGAPAALRPLLAAMTARDPAARPTAAGVRERLAALVPDGMAGVAAAAPAVDPEAPTVVTPPAGGTSVMPTAMIPVAAAPAAAATAAHSPEGPGARPKHVVWGMAVGLAVAVVLGLATRSGGDEVPPSTTGVAVAEVDPTTTSAPPTTEPSTTTEPPAEDRERDDDDEDDGDDDDRADEGRGDDGGGPPSWAGGPGGGGDD